MVRQLDDWIEGWLQYTNHIEATQIIHKWVAISTLASLCGRRVKLLWDKPVYPNFYIFLVAPPGKARKGSAMLPARALLDRLEISITADVVTFERFCQFMEKTKSRETKLVKTLDASCEVTIHSEELTNLLSKNKLDLIHAFTRLYDCPNFWSYETKGAGSNRITNSFTNLIGATQPQLISQFLPEEAISGGLMSRVIPVYEDRRGKIMVFPFDYLPKKELTEAIWQDAKTIMNMEGYFTIDQGFKDAWEQWYPTQEYNVNLIEPRLDHYVERRPHHLLKLCMIFNISRNGGMKITAQDFDSGLQLLCETERKMSRTFAGLGRAEHAEVSNMVSGYIFASGKVRYKQLLRRFHKETEEDRLSKIIAVMENLGDINIIAHPTDPRDYYIEIAELMKGDKDVNQN